MGVSASGSMQDSLMAVGVPSLVQGETKVGFYQSTPSNHSNFLNPVPVTMPSSCTSYYDHVHLNTWSQATIILAPGCIILLSIE
jgi:hypothetical protein